MVELMVEHQAGLPILMKPLSGKSSEVHECSHVVREHLAQLPTTYATTYRGAESALSSAANLQQLAETHITWMTRVPATLSDAQAALAQAEAHTMAPLTEGERSRVGPSPSGGGEQRWVRIDSEPRQAQAQRTVDTQRLTHRAQAMHAFTPRSRTPFACAADARPALATFVAGLPATFLPEVPVHPTPHYRKRGRPGQDAQPDQVVSHIAGALASRVAVRQTLVEQHTCCLLATHDLDEAHLSPQEGLAGSKGQAQAERGFRFRKALQFCASSFSLAKPARIMALLMVMTVCWLVDAALESRIRTALKAHDATFPDQKGKPVQHPTARGSASLLWGCMCCSSLGNGTLWSCISPRSTSHCSGCLGNRMRDGIAAYSQKCKGQCGMSVLPLP
jgi:transposase